METRNLRQECSRLRILVVGKSGVGKSALINAVFGADVTTVSHHKPAVHDIDKALTHPSNNRFIIHDSRGFETGDKERVRRVVEFIDHCRKAPSPAEQLHAIWVCAEIPFAGSRVFEAGVERIFREYHASIPIIVVFTKVDLLYLHQEDKVLERFDHLNDDEVAAKVDEIAKEEIETRCFQRLLALTPENGSAFPCVITSADNEPKSKQSIQKLLDLTLSLTGPRDRVDRAGHGPTV